MSKHRVFLLTLGLLAMMGFMSSQAHAETMTLTVYAGSGTSGAVLYSTLGSSANSVTADVAALNGALSGGGFAAYTFSNLGGVSNNPGANNPIGGVLQAAGDLSVTAGSGAGTPITIVVTEDGFTAPSGGLGGILSDRAITNYAGIRAGGTTAGTGMFAAPSISPTVTGSTSPSPAVANGNILDIHDSSSTTNVSAYQIPYTLISMTVISVNPGTSRGSVGILNKVELLSGIPEPASVVMMLTGMPLPLVVLGILRRRRAAA
jgi:hypothetical protein